VKTLMNGRLSLLAVVSLGAASVVAMLPHGSEAVQTRTMVLDSASDFASGTLERTAVTSDGSVVLGQDLTRVALDPAASGAWSLFDAGDALYAGTATDGRVYRIANGRAEHWANTGGVAVTAITAGDTNATLYAAVVGSGTIVKLRAPENGAPRDGERFAALPGVEHVWALAYDRARHILFAATGPDGKLFAIDAQGRATVLFDSAEPNLYSLALGANNTVYVGTGGNAAVVYAVRGPSDARAVARFTGNEVKRIVPVGDLLYVAANEFGEGVPAPPRMLTQTRSPSPGGTGASRPRPGRGGLYLVRPNGVSERLYQNAETHLTSLEWDATRREALVGLGANGRVIAVAEDRTARIAFDVDEASVLALSLTGRTRAFATGDSGAVYLVGAGAAQRATWTSRVLDASNPARWGAVRWRGAGALDWEIRSGNSEPADATWSAWTPLREDGTVGDVNARYLQVRARWTRDPATILRAVTVYYLPTNQRPVLTEVTAESRAGDVRPPVVRLNWKVENPDSDALRYRVRYRGDAETGWRSLLRNSDYTTGTSVEWNVEGLPEGFYRVSVEASDEAANADGDALSDRRESEPVLVDMTPPTVSARVENGRIVGDARDGASAVTRVEISVDTLEWRPARAGDGVFDEREERFEARSPAGLPAGEHTVAIRAYDEAGNMGATSVTLRVGAAAPAAGAARAAGR
jgi:hypothetical protein